MMPSDQQAFQKLEHTLARVHQGRQTTVLEQEWTDGVMRQVRRTMQQATPTSADRCVERLIWQSAAVAAVVALIMTLSFMIWSPGVPREGSRLVAEEFESMMFFVE